MSLRGAIAAFWLVAACFAAPAGAEWKFLSEETIGGFKHPLSVACDTMNIYVAQDGSSVTPTAENDNGSIVHIEYGYNDKIKKRETLNVPEPLHRPSGLYLFGENLWMVDLDQLWEFDLERGTSEKRTIPGIKMGDNIGADLGGHLYISDTRADRIVWWGTSDFLHALRDEVIKPIVTLYKDGGLHPAAANGRYYGGGLFIFPTTTKPEGEPVYFMPSRSTDMKLSPTFLVPPPVPFTPAFGSYGAGTWLQDGALLMTDMASGSLVRWTEKGGFVKLATGFGEPVSFCMDRHRMDLARYRIVVADKAKGVIRALWFQTN